MNRNDIKSTWVTGYKITQQNYSDFVDAIRFKSDSVSASEIIDLPDLSKLQSISVSGDGTQYLANDGTYKTVSASGIQGPMGPQGATGPQGIQGEVGPPGQAGPQGASGSQGPQGPQGIQGLSGLNGVPRGAYNSSTNYLANDIVTYNGSAWFAIDDSVNQTPAENSYWTLFVAKGDQGIQGVAGPTGASGSQGIQGIQGPVGPQGASGIQGIQGPQGIQGFAGLNGVPRGAFNSSTNYLTDDIVTYNGSSWLAIDDSLNISPEEGSYWTLFVAKGDQGIQGPTGPQGIQGVQGLQGLQGVQGIQGEDGPAGPQGIQGLTGINGVPRGAFNSSTTYIEDDIVTYNGSAWLALQSSTNNPPTENSYWTLFVAKGDTGLQGIQGEVGPQGPAGPTGASGSQGPQGIQGVPGVAGSSGGIYRYAIDGLGSYVVATVEGITVSKPGGFKAVLENPAGSGLIMQASIRFATTEATGTTCYVDFGQNIGTGPNNTYDDLNYPQFQVWQTTINARGMKATVGAHMNINCHTIAITNVTSGQAIAVNLSF